jgi:hypothetical protein
MLLAIFSNMGDSSPHGALVTFAFSTHVYDVGNITTWVATAEILTTEIRTTGHSAANAFARIGGFCAPYLVQQSTPPMVIGSVMLGMAILTTLAVARLPETNGKTLGLHPSQREEQDNTTMELTSQAPESTVV